MTEHVHEWRHLEVGIGPWSAESAGPLAAELLDHPDVGDVIRSSIAQGELVLSDAEAEELTETHDVRYCATCGRLEEREDGEWVFVSVIDFSHRPLPT